jgi:hypothetical protein
VPSRHVLPGPTAGLSQDERTYHVLYQLCRGCSHEHSAKLRLLPAADFHYLGVSAALKVPSECMLIASLGDSVVLGLVHASAHHDAPPTSPQVSGVDDVEWWAASCMQVLITTPHPLPHRYPGSTT